MMETGLFEIQAEHLRYWQAHQLLAHSRDAISAVFGRVDSDSRDAPDVSVNGRNDLETVSAFGMRPHGPAIEFARCFLRLANLPNFALDRLSRYEATLWRQADQILFALDMLDRRKPQDRTRRFPVGD
jgi:hypothetical protein